MKKGRSGMTLVEVIVAASLVGLIFLFLFGLLPSSAYMTRQAQQQSSATYLAEEIMAELGSLPFEQLDAAVGTLTPAAPGILGARLSPRTLSDNTVLNPMLELVAIPPDDRLVQATVTISWQVGPRNPNFRLVRRFSSVLR